MCHSCASRNPEKQLDSRFRGNDIQGGISYLPRSLLFILAEEGLIISIIVALGEREGKTLGGVSILVPARWDMEPPERADYRLFMEY
jgi:hypothetical protein